MTKKLISAMLAFSLSTAMTTAFAFDTGETSAEYEYLDKVSGFAAEMYIDDTVTKEDIMKMGFDKLLEQNPDLVEKVLKLGFSSLDDYSE